MYYSALVQQRCIRPPQVYILNLFVIFRDRAVVFSLVFSVLFITSIYPTTMTTYYLSCCSNSICGNKVMLVSASTSSRPSTERTIIGSFNSMFVIPESLFLVVVICGSHHNHTNASRYKTVMNINNKRLNY